jgi:hypothetical protein
MRGVHKLIAVSATTPSVPSHPSKTRSSQQIEDQKPRLVHLQQIIILRRNSLRFHDLSLSLLLRRKRQDNDNDRKLIGCKVLEWNIEKEKERVREIGEDERK